MYILGIIAFGENPAACLVHDGRLVALVEEERFSRLKSSHGMFPSGAVAWCLYSNKLALSDIDRIAFGWDTGRYPWRMAGTFARTFVSKIGRSRQHSNRGYGGSSFLTALDQLMFWHPTRIRGLIQDGLRSAGLKGEIPKIEFVQHHLAHAYSTFAVSGFEQAGILTLDGSGEDTSTQLAVGKGDEIRIVDSFPIPHSLGWFYAAVTQYLGFIPYRDEGKLMGLAALGENRRAQNKWIEPLSRVLRIGERGYEVDPQYTHLGRHNYGDRFTDAFAELVMSIDRQAVPISYGEKAEIGGEIISRYLLDEYVDIAWAAQDLLERAAVVLAKRLVQEQGVENLCLAGGVALNCKMNGEILRQSGAKNIFVQPASNDSGAALGAALYVSKQMGANIRHPLKHAYYGPEFNNDAIRGALDACKIDYQTVANPASQAADLLADGKIVAWFQGAMEFGSRALGNRSILASPARKNMRERVNKEVKFREFWRPFCPSMTEAVKGEYLRNPGEASFMIVAYEAEEKCSRDLSSVVHVDNTVRPQVVREDDNPIFHELIKNVGHQTGHEVVLNTSFNVRGEPIVCTPHEAIRCFFSSGLDSLVIGDFVLNKTVDQM
jgi:carbamoyltransferase